MICSHKAAVAGPIRLASARILLDRPVLVAAMAGRHVVGHGGVAVIAAHAKMRGDPLAPEEYLHRPDGEPGLDLGAGEAVGNRVIMAGDFDMVVDADAAGFPLRELVRLGRQRLERRSIDRPPAIAGG